MCFTIWTTIEDQYGITISNIAEFKNLFNKPTIQAITERIADSIDQRVINSAEQIGTTNSAFIGDVLGVDLGNAPHLPAPRLEMVLGQPPAHGLARQSSCAISLTISSASRSSIQRARPAGGFEEAVATSTPAWRMCSISMPSSPIRNSRWSALTKARSS